MKFEADDFAIWKESPITQAVLKFCSDHAEDAKQTWLNHSWDGMACDERVLSALKARADMAEMIVDLTLEQLEDESSGAE